MNARTAPRYLVTGRAGNGKSSFINAAFGRHVARTDPFESCTTLVEHYALGTPLGDIVLIDTPGFADGDPEADYGRARMIAEHVRLDDLEAVLYVTKLTETRLRADEKRTVRALTQQFGAAFWRKAWLIFTFAADVEPTRRALQVRERRALIHGAVSESAAQPPDRIPFRDFRQCYLVDNITPNWTDDCVSIASVLEPQR